VVTVTI
jgi:hypothetical protein